jgi:hypothetical protein
MVEIRAAVLPELPPSCMVANKPTFAGIKTALGDELFENEVWHA